MLKHLISVMTLAVIILNLFPLPTSAEDTASSWLDLTDPTFRLINELPADSVPRNCVPNTKFITVPQNKIAGQAEKSHQACAKFSPAGIFDNSKGNFAYTNSSVSGPVKLFSGATVRVNPIPSTNHAYYSTSEPVYGTHKHVLKNFATSIDTFIQTNGSIIHKVKQNAEVLHLSDPAGDIINFSNIHFSNNGKWMIGNAHQRGLYRLNIDTGEALIYSAGYNHAAGTSPHFKSAISNDGRYVIDTEDSYGILTIRDLSVCTPAPSPKTPSTCPYKNLTSLAKSKITNFKRVENIEFSTNYTLRLQVRRLDNSLGYYTLTANGRKESLSDYIALGDSFASGEGAYDYRPETDIKNQNTCHLSRASYPFLLTGVTANNSVACSGAKIKDIINANYHEGEAQAKGKNASWNDSDILSNYLPGYRPQINFLEKYKPQNVTISIGGNDIGFGQIIISCIKYGTCYNDPQERLNLVHTINSKQDQLISTYEELKKNISTEGAVYAIGYPSLAKEDGNCALNVLLNNDEIIFSNLVINHLNSVIKRAAQKAGITYIDITNALVGHRLCENTSQNIAVNGATAGDNKTFSIPIGNYTIEGHFTGSESYHPNKLGHQLIARAIAGATNNFQTTNPKPEDINNLELADSHGLVSTEDIKNLQPARIDLRDSLSNTVLIKGKEYSVKASGLLPNTTSSQSLGSTSTEIVTDSIGTVNKSFMVPESMQVGLQTLKLNTISTSGETISIQKLVYVAANEQDFDGDGTPNSDEKCLLENYQETDQDICESIKSNVVSPPITDTPKSTDTETNTKLTIRDTEPLAPTEIHPSDYHESATRSANLNAATNPPPSANLKNKYEEPTLQREKNRILAALNKIERQNSYLMPAIILGGSAIVLSASLIARNIIRKRLQ